MAAVNISSEREGIWKTLQLESLDTINEATQMEYFRLIEDGEHEVMKDWPSERQAKLLQLEHPHYCDMRPLEYALRSENFDFIQTIFDKCSVSPILEALREKNQDGDNFVQLLTQALQGSTTPSISVSGKQPVCNKTDKIKKLFDSIFALAADNSTMLFKLFSERNVDNECAVLGLMKHTEATDLVRQWLTKLTTEQRIAALKEKVCYCGQRHETSDSKCDRWYNLPMCALAFQSRQVMNKIYKILKKTSSEADATEILLGRRSAVVDESASSNILLIAAEMKNWEWFKKLLETLPKEHRACALLETNHAGKSALQELVQSSGDLKETLKIVSPELKNLIASNTYCKYRFMELKMPQDSIEMLEKEKVFGDRYIIPKHSDGSSQPAVIILHADLGEDSSVDEAAAKDMERAFSKLGWENVKLIDSSAPGVDIKHEVEQNIEEMKKNCSLFVLCITAGAAANLRTRENPLKMSELLLANLPDFIPKVLILDEYKGSPGQQEPKPSRSRAKKKAPQKSERDKILVLQPTAEKKSDDSYLKLLAAEVERGNETLQEMHKRTLGETTKQVLEIEVVVRITLKAKRNFSSSDVHSSVDLRAPKQKKMKSHKKPDTQTKTEWSPLSTTKDIFLRKCVRQCRTCKIDLDLFTHSMSCFKCRSSFCDECDGLDKGERVVNIPGLVWICPLC